MTRVVKGDQHLLMTDKTYEIDLQPRRRMIEVWKDGFKAV